MFFAAAYGNTANSLPPTAITNSLHTSKLTAITASTLTIHTEDSYTATVNSVSTNIKMVNDFFYIK